MRYLVLSDIHANLQALDAVLADSATLGYDAALVLGDLVGYGGDPAAVIDRIFALEPAAMIRGNHDKLCAGLDDPSNFNDEARQAIAWTADTLGAADMARLAALPKGPMPVEDGVLICHGAPDDEDHYILGPEDARRAMKQSAARLCLFGHTHRPAAFGSVTVERSTRRSVELRLFPGGRALINVGSVGQPRDHDPRAAYGIVDTDADTVLVRRVEYDVAGAQARILRAGLPAMLAERLAVGQ